MKINPLSLPRLTESSGESGVSTGTRIQENSGIPSGAGSVFEVQNPMLLEAFQRLAGTLMQAPDTLLKAGNEEALAEFLKQARFEPSQLLQDLRTVSSLLSRLPVGHEVVLAGHPQQGLVWSPDHGFRAQGSMDHGIANSGGVQKQWHSPVANVGAQAMWNHRLGQQAEGQVSVSPDGIRAQGNAWLGARAGGAFQADLRGPLGDASIRGRGDVAAQAWGQGQAHLGANGLQAQGNMGAEGRISGALDATFQNALLRSDTRLEAGGVVGANAQGNVQMNAMGLQGNLAASAKAEVAAELRNQTRSVGVNVGGERLDVNSEVKAVAQAGARAGADVEVVATVLPPRAGVDAEVGAFAGAKAGVEGKIGLGDFVAVKGKAEAWAGAGAQAGLIAGLKDGKLRFGFHAGAAVEVGAGFRWSVEIDVQKIAKALVGGSLQVAERGLEFAINPLGASIRTVQEVTSLLSGKEPGTLELGSRQSVLPLSGVATPLLQQHQIRQQASDLISQAVSQWLGPDPQTAE